MPRFFVLAVLFVIVLAVSLGILLFFALFPYFHIIGLVAAGLVITARVCAAGLIVAFTLNQIGTWSADRHRHQLYAQVIVAGEVVAFPQQDGKIIHLSAMHEAAKVTPQLPAPALQQEEPQASKETVLELYDRGISLRNIAEATGLTYYAVQKITSQKRAQ